MIQKAVVKKIIDRHHAEIEVQRQSACGHDCAKCGGCGAPTERIQAITVNSVGAGVGDIVTVEGSSKQILGMAALVYAMPLVLFFVFYGVCAGMHLTEGVSILMGAVGFVLGIWAAIRRNHQMKKSGEIVFTIVKKG